MQTAQSYAPGTGRKCMTMTAAVGLFVSTSSSNRNGGKKSLGGEARCLHPTVNLNHCRSPNSNRLDGQLKFKPLDRHAVTLNRSRGCALIYLNWYCEFIA